MLLASAFLEDQISLKDYQFFSKSNPFLITRALRECRPPSIPIHITSDAVDDIEGIALGTISQRDLSPDLGLNLRLWS